MQPLVAGHSGSVRRRRLNSGSQPGARAPILKWLPGSDSYRSVNLKNTTATSRRYVLVTPARDEEATIGRTIESVLSQTNHPAEWVVVSDGSTDGTDECVKKAARQHPWIRLIQIPPRPQRSFAAVVENTEKGIAALETDEHDYVGLLDADVVFQKDYFDKLMQRFEEDPQLGLAGGVVIDIGTPRDRLPRNRLDVPGAVQFFRRSCLESLGRLQALPEGGWDALTCAVARMNGYKTLLCTDLIVDHLKPRNISQGGMLRRKWQMGVRDYAMGYHPVFEFAKCLGRASTPPLILGAVVWFLGYVSGSVKRIPRVVPAMVVRHVRSEQLRRLSCAFRRQGLD